MTHNGVLRYTVALYPYKGTCTYRLIILYTSIRNRSWNKVQLIMSTVPYSTCTICRSTNTYTWSRTCQTLHLSFYCTSQGHLQHTNLIVQFGVNGYHSTNCQLITVSLIIVRIAVVSKSFNRIAVAQYTCCCQHCNQLRHCSQVQVARKIAGRQT